VLDSGIGSEANNEAVGRPPPTPPTTRKAILVETGVAFSIATGLAAAAYRVSFAVPWLARNLHVVVAAVFLYLPAAIAFRRGEDLADYGLRWRGAGKGLLLATVAMLVVFPPFVVGFYLWQKAVCATGSPLAPLAMPGQFAAFAMRATHSLADLARGHVSDGAMAVLSEVIVTALPEELFFRGYLMKRLEAAFPPRRRLWGGGVGIALVLQAVLFTLGHVLVYFDLGRLAVFFPAFIFGWMRSRTDGIAAGTAFHASSNLLMRFLSQLY
jgi:membrane protease YdiL (CAAX protease family)